ncbi:hypothetical protein [Streptomyces oceani]|uniref:hypothetical protein n=1 Tax=Streptomyces oceani TaxID=1075402 RepID=UPI001FCD0FB3|nr:hypothetical protein [Streptomyces oceani]
MARDYDSQLLESVSVRRRRLRDALLFGSQRMRRSLDEGAGKLFGGIALAAVVCAGCVGWSFISDRMLDDDKKDTGSSATRTETVTIVPRAKPAGITKVTETTRISP